MPLQCSLLQSMSETIDFCCSGCGSVGEAIDSNSRGPLFESSHHQKSILNVYCQLCWKDENKVKEVGIGWPIFKHNWLLSLWLLVDLKSEWCLHCCQTKLYGQKIIEKFPMWHDLRMEIERVFPGAADGRYCPSIEMDQISIPLLAQATPTFIFDKFNLTFETSLFRKTFGGGKNCEELFRRQTLREKNTHLFFRGSINVWLTSCLTGLESPALLILN